MKISFALNRVYKNSFLNFIDFFFPIKKSIRVESSSDNNLNYTFYTFRSFCLFIIGVVGFYIRSVFYFFVFLIKNFSICVLNKSGYISVDNITSTGNGFSTNNQTWTHVVSGNNTMLVVGVGQVSSTNNVSSISFGGTSLYYAGGISEDICTVAIYYLNGVSGSQNISVTFSSSTSNWCSAISFSGADSSTGNFYSSYASSPFSSQLYVNLNNIYLSSNSFLFLHSIIRSLDAIADSQFLLELSSGQTLNNMTQYGDAQRRKSGTSRFFSSSAGNYSFYHRWYDSGSSLHNFFSVIAALEIKEFSSPTTHIIRRRLLVK